MIKFSIDECEQIINLSTILPKTRRDEYPRPIKYTFYSIPHSKKYQWIFDRMNNYFTEKTGIKVIQDLDTIHLFDYEEGDQFPRHKDVYYEGQVYNVGACLNDDYDGGHFILHKPEEIISKKRGTIYTFKCSREHEVTEVTKGHRWSLIGFYFYKHLDLKPPMI